MSDWRRGWPGLAAGVGMSVAGLLVTAPWPGGILLGGGVVLAGTSLLALRGSRRGGGERIVRRRAAWDALNGLVTPEELRRRVARARSLAPQRPRALLFVSLDGAGEARARWGRVLYEEHLAALADALRQGLSARDSAARVGQDELAVLVDHAGAPMARRVARSVCATVRGLQLEWGGEYQALTASVGIAFPEPEEGFDDLLGRAAAAARRARAAGGDRASSVAGGDAPPGATEADWAVRWRRALQAGVLQSHVRELPALDPGEPLWVMLAPGLPAIAPGSVPLPTDWAEGGAALRREIDRTLLLRALGWDGRLQDGRRAAHVCVHVSRALLHPPEDDPWLDRLPRLHPASAPVTVLVDEADATAAPGAALDLAAGLRAAGLGLGLREWGSGLGSFALPGRLGVRTVILSAPGHAFGSEPGAHGGAAFLGWARVAAEAAGVETVVAPGAADVLARAGIPRTVGPWLSAPAPGSG